MPARTAPKEEDDAEVAETAEAAEAAEGPALLQRLCGCSYLGCEGVATHAEAY